MCFCCKMQSPRRIRGTGNKRNQSDQASFSRKPNNGSSNPAAARDLACESKRGLSNPDAARQPSRGSSNRGAPDIARNLVRDSIIQVSRCNYLNESFVPCNEIDKLVTRDFVQSTLVESKIDNHERLVEFIVGSPGAKRLFLILGRAGKFHLLGTLHDNQFDDRALPVGFLINADRITEGYLLGDPDSRVYSFFDEWDENDRILLEARQWEFLAPKFGEGAFRIPLQRAHRLPYLTRRAQPSGGGFFGEVYHAEILKAHLAQGPWPTVSRPSDSHLGFLNAYTTRLRKGTPSRLPSRKPRTTNSSPASLIERQTISDKSGRSMAHLTSSSPLRHTAMATKDA